MELAEQWQSPHLCPWKIVIITETNLLLEEVVTNLLLQKKLKKISQDHLQRSPLGGESEN